MDLADQSHEYPLAQELVGHVMPNKLFQRCQSPDLGGFVYYPLHVAHYNYVSWQNMIYDKNRLIFLWSSWQIDGASKDLMAIIRVWFDSSKTLSQIKSVFSC